MTSSSAALLTFDAIDRDRQRWLARQSGMNGHAIESVGAWASDQNARDAQPVGDAHLFSLWRASAAAHGDGFTSVHQLMAMHHAWMLAEHHGIPLDHPLWATAHPHQKRWQRWAQDIEQQCRQLGWCDGRRYWREQKQRGLSPPGWMTERKLVDATAHAPPSAVLYDTDHDEYEQLCWQTQQWLEQHPEEMMIVMAADQQRSSIRDVMIQAGLGEQVAFFHPRPITEQNWVKILNACLSYLLTYPWVPRDHLERLIAMLPPAWPLRASWLAMMGSSSWVNVADQCPIAYESSATKLPSGWLDCFQSLWTRMGVMSLCDDEWLKDRLSTLMGDWLASHAHTVTPMSAQVAVDDWITWLSCTPWATTVPRRSCVVMDPGWVFNPDAFAACWVPGMTSAWDRPSVTSSYLPQALLKPHEPRPSDYVQPWRHTSLHVSCAKTYQGQAVRPASLMASFEVARAPMPERQATEKHLRRDEGILPQEQLRPLTSSQLTEGAHCLMRGVLCHHFRLDASPVDSVGFDASLKGQWLHGTMEALWRDLQTQSALIQLSDPEREARLQSAMRRAYDDLRVQSVAQAPTWEDLSGYWLPRLMQWLTVEAERLPFRIWGLEYPLEVEHGGCVYRVRIDRIDELEDGGLLLIDYKSGLVSPSLWADELPQQLQLPLYGYLMQQEGHRVSGLVFIQLRSDRCRWMAFGEDQTLQGEGWSVWMQRWSHALTQLSQRVCSGLPHLDPRDPYRLCTTCDFRPHCRRDA